MALDFQLVGTILGALLSAVVGAVATRALEKRSKLIAYYGHRASVGLPPNPGDSPTTPRPFVNMHAVVIRNVGRKAATNVRVSHWFLPDSFSVFPSAQHFVEEVRDNGKDIVFPVLVPGQQVTINYVYGPNVTWDRVNSGVRSDDGLAQVVPVLLSRQYPRWVNVTALALMVSGAAAIAYVLVAFVRRALLH